MPARELQEQLDTLREQLEQNPPLTFEEREHLQDLMQKIEAEIKLENATQDQDVSLADNVNAAVEHFEINHPTVAGTLRNIVEILVSIGV